jgi:hypothetical protein
MHGIYKNSWGKTECKRKQGSTNTGVREIRGRKQEFRGCELITP